MDDDVADGLLGISISDSEDSSAEKAQPAVSKESRTAQSEEAFQEVKKTYKAKIENGELWKAIEVPLPVDVGKMEAREALYAVEELYFFGRFEEAVGFIGGVVGGGIEGLDGEVRGTLEYYLGRCRERMKRES